MPALAGAAALAGCSGSLSALDPGGPAAASIASLWWIMAAGSAAIFATVSAILLVAWVRPAALGRQPARPLILWGGLAFPSVVLGLLLIAALWLGEGLIARTGPTAGLRVEVTARQWQWEFRYPAGETSIDVLHIPAGTEIEFSVASADVIHSFWIPSLGGKIDAIPGHVNRIRLSADRAGRFGGICAEFCGLAHTDMRFTVIVHEPEAYEAALAGLWEAEQ